MCLTELSKLKYFSLHKARNMHVCVYICACKRNIFGWTVEGLSREPRGEGDGLQGWMAAFTSLVLQWSYALFFYLICVVLRSSIQQLSQRGKREETEVIYVKSEKLLKCNIKRCILGLNFRVCSTLSSSLMDVCRDVKIVCASMSLFENAIYNCGFLFWL